MPDARYASLSQRFVAAVIDNASWFLGVSMVFGFVPVAAYEDSPEAIGVLTIVLLTAWFNYFALCEWRFGQTIGKNVMGLRVVPVTGGRMSFGAASLRNLLRIADFFVVGWVMIARSERRQRLGDRLARTLVMKEKDALPRVAGDDVAPVPVEKPHRPGVRNPRRGAAVTWGASQAWWGLLAGLGLALILAPLLVVPFDAEFESLGAKLTAQGLLSLALIATAVWFASRPRSFTPRVALGRLGLRRFAPSAMGWALLALFAYYVSVAVYAALFIEPEQEDISGDLGLGGESLIAAIVAVALIALVAPAAEELFFRGFFFAGLRARLPVWPAALVSGAIFGVIHAPSGLTTVIPLGLLGVALAWLYERTGSLWPCVLAHCINNSLALAVAG